MINVSRIPGAHTTVFLSRGALHDERPEDLHFCEILVCFAEIDGDTHRVFVDDQEITPRSGEIMQDCMDLARLALPYQNL